MGKSDFAGAFILSRTSFAKVSGTLRGIVRTGEQRLVENSLEDVSLATSLLNPSSLSHSH